MVGGLGMEDIMMTPGMDNLNIITSGVIPPNPAEITDSRRMGEFLQEVKQAYDVVLVDSPPILQATDATILGTKVDGTLLVYKIGNVSRSALRRAKLQLDNVNVEVMGVVINGLKAEISEDFRDLRYYSYYSYGSQVTESGNPIVREYNRLKRRAASVYRVSLPQVKKLLDTVGIDVHWGDDEAQPQPQDGDSPPQSIKEQVKLIVLWGLVGLLILMGILWQIGYLGHRTASRDVVATSFANLPETPPQPVDSPPTVDRVVGTKPVSDPTTKEDPGHKLLPLALPKMTVATSEPTVLDGKHRDLPNYGVHIASYRTRGSAQKALQRLAERGFVARTSPTEVNGRGIFYRIVVGNVSSIEQARAIADKLDSRGIGGYTKILRHAAQ